MNFSSFVKSRLAVLGYGQKDLARAVQVTDSYISQLLTRRKAPPDCDRTDIYKRMETFLQLDPGELSRLVEIERTEEIRRRLGQAPEPLFREFRELVLNKCDSRKREEVRAVFSLQPFGILERLVTRQLLEVVQQIARQELEAENCVAFLDPLLESWSVDLESLRIDIMLNAGLVAEPHRTFTFVESTPADDPDPQPGLADFLDDPRLDDPVTEEEIRLLRCQRFNGRQPTKLYYYRALQNLRDPLHFRKE